MNFKKDRAEWFLELLAVCLASAVLAQSTVPTITAIRAEGTNCVVTVSIPEGMQRVTLETSDRAGRLSWLPRAVVRPNLKAGVATFRLPMVRTIARRTRAGT